MKTEIEFKWIVNLLNSEFLAGGFFRKQKSGCKSDFEKVAQAPLNSKEFSGWFDDMIVKKVFFCDADEQRFLINASLLEQELKNNPLYSSTRRIFQKKAGFFELAK